MAQSRATSFYSVAKEAGFARAAFINPAFRARLAKAHRRLDVWRVTKEPRTILAPIAPVLRDLERDAEVVFSGRRSRVGWLPAISMLQPLPPVGQGYNTSDPKPRRLSGSPFGRGHRIRLPGLRRVAPKRPATRADQCPFVAPELTRCGHHPTAESDPFRTFASRTCASADEPSMYRF
jgi:hypothetical protein